MTDQVAKLMKALSITEQEALELIEEDKKIDRMSQKEVTADLTDEQKKAVKKATGTGTKKSATVYKFDTEKSKNRKKDDEKVEIVRKIAEFMQNITDNAKIENEGQKISFSLGENSYSLTLTKHRN